MTEQREARPPAATPELAGPGNQEGKIQASPRSVARRPRLRFARLRDLALIPALVIICIIGTLVSPVFLTQQNLINILQQQSEIALVVLAEAMILIAGRLDLSLESTVGLAPAIAAWLVLPKVPGHGSGLELAGGWAIPTTLAVGLVIGVINGLLIVRFQLNGFIVTLGMLITLRGLQNGISGGQTYFGLPQAMLYLGTTEWLGMPASVWVSLLLFAIGMFVLGYTRFGRALYAIGGNSAAAKAAGIKVDRVVWITLIVGSLLAAVAGLLLAGRLGSVAENSGNGWIFTVFAGAVIGGISMNGGKGTIFGAFTGILLLFVVQNVLTLAGISAAWINFLNGAIILAALVVSRLASGQAQNA